MYLHDIDFGHVFNASGARGFYGEGYWFHKWLKPVGLNYKGCTFIAKTTTLRPRKGNMALNVDSGPLDLLPDCIVIKLKAGVVLNAVGLSGPGAETLLTRWRLTPPPSPFVISFMSVAGSPAERLQEAKDFFTLLTAHGYCRRATALQLNFSCPNAGLDLSHLVDEIFATLDESQKLKIPTMIKLNALVPVESAHYISDHAGCDALVMSNTIPWGQLADRIDWKGIFGSDVSPLVKYGSGGLSGEPLLPIVTEWIHKARIAGIDKPIIGGGGVLSAKGAAAMIDVGADAIELGSVSILRPWRVAGIVRYVNRRLQSKSTRIV